jgi:hypothetical protein
MKKQSLKKLFAFSIALMMFSALPKFVNAQKKSDNGKCPKGYYYYNGYCYPNPSPPPPCRSCGIGLDKIQNEDSVAGIIKPSQVIKLEKKDPSFIKSSLKQLMRPSDDPKFEVEGRINFTKTKELNSASLTSDANTRDNSARGNTCINPPLLLSNFEGNPLTPFYLPPVGYYASESNIAISNSGKIVSISNGWIRYYKEDGTLTFSDSLYHFCSGLIDVHVAYDSKADRFVFVASYGLTDFVVQFQQLGVVVAFSKTNDPINGWNFYYLPDSVYKDNCSEDYPLLAISDNEVFVTELRINKGGNISNSLIIQLDKNAGYAGMASINSQVYQVQLTTKTNGAVVPAPGGSATYGPNMYFIMGDESGKPSDKFYVLEISNTIASGSAVLKTYGPVHSNIYASAVGTSYQPGGIPLGDITATMDDFVENAFFENGVLQFCRNTNVNGKASVYLGRLTGIPGNIICTAKTISDPNLYLSYPAIAYTGKSSSDNSAIVGFEHTGLSTYPGLSAVSVNNNFDVSSGITVKAGNDTINSLWGDYSGICRRYNHPGECWMEGQYGSITFPNINWIAQLKIQQCSSTQFANAEEMKTIAPTENSLSVFPNPFSNSTTISFSLPKFQKVSVTIYDLNGRSLRTLADEEMQAGAHQLTWNVGSENVIAGIYLVKLQTGDFVETKKISLVK